MSDLNCTCYRIRKAARRVTQIYDHHLAGVGLTANQLGVLALMSRGGAMSMGALAGEMGADPSTMTRNMRPLIEAGLVEAAGGEGDGRVRAVRLTGAGNDKLAAAVAPWREAERAVVRALGAHDAALLRELLGRVSVAALDEAAAPAA